MPADEFVWIDGGDFSIGSEEFYPDEGPSRDVRVDGFWIAATAVTNARFAEFVEATGYVTEAEQAPDPDLYPGVPRADLVPGALVFTMTDGPVDLDDYARWWRWTPGASWQRPFGDDSTLDGLSDHPVVHVSHADAVAYCAWAGAELPTEAEWEVAARGGLEGARFTWGNDDPQESQPVANTWQGRFPYENTALDGWVGTAPVASYPPNGYGLFDMAGNVWEWTADWYSSTPAGHGGEACCGGPSMVGSLDASFPEVSIPRRVIKGGSFLCTPQYCYRYRPAARQPQMIDTATSHIGFRPVRRRDRSHKAHLPWGDRGDGVSQAVGEKGDGG